MARIVVLLRGLRPSKKWIVPAVLSLVLPLFIGLGWAFWALSAGEEPPLDTIAGLWALGLLAFFALLIYGRRERTSAVQKELTRFANGLRVVGSELILPRPVRIQIGRMRAWGAMAVYLTGMRGTSLYPRSYYHLSEFEAEEDLGEKEAVDLELLSKPFTFIADVNGGYLSAPAIKAELLGGEAVVVAVLDPSTIGFERDEVSLRAVGEEDRAEASLRFEGRRIKGIVNRPVLGKARDVRLELHGSLKVPVPKASWPLREVEKYITLVLARTEDKPSLSFEHAFPPGELTIIVTHEEALDPVALVEELGLHGPVITGFFEGRYELKLVLDIPLRPDVVSTVELPALRAGEPGSTRS